MPRSPNSTQRPQLVGTPLSTEEGDVEATAIEPNADRDIPGLDSKLLGYVKQGSFGPYRASNENHTIALWASPDDENTPRWFSKNLAVRPPTDAVPLALAKAPEQVEHVALAAVEDGFLALYSHPSSTGTRLTAMALNLDGSSSADLAPLLNTSSELLWLSAVSLNGQPTALWATRKKKKSAALYLASLTPAGTAVGAPVQLAQRARAWQTLPWSDGIAVATISQDPGPAQQRRLEVAFFNELGALLSRELVASGRGIGADLDASVIGGQLVLAWTQTPSGRTESTVWLATLGQNGKLLVAPHIALDQFGAQRLVEIVTPRGGRADGFLVWENVGQAPVSERRLLLARLSEKASISEQQGVITFLGTPGSSPEIVASQGGLVALTQALPCPRFGESCNENQAVPTYVEFDRQLRVVASEPIRLTPEQGATATLGWDLQCESEFCTALGALDAAPVPVHEVQLRARSSHFRLSGETLTATSPPSVTTMKLVTKLKPLSSISSAAVGKQSLLATLSQFDPEIPYKLRRTAAPDGRLGPVRAILELRRLDAEGSVSGTPNVLSYRARSVAGVKILSVPGKRAVVIWSALDNKQPEVFATLVDSRGQRLQQRMLTRTTGEVRTVTAATLKQGLLAVWIDERDGSPQVYSARLKASLGRAAKQRKLSSGKKPIQAVGVLHHQNKLWLAQIEGPALGPQSVLLVQLDEKTGEPRGSARSVATSARGGLAAPKLLPGPEGKLNLLWLDTTSGELFSSPVSDDKSSEAEIRTIGSWPQPLRGFDAECDDSGCHAVLDIRDPRGSRLSGVQWSNDKPTSSVSWLWRKPPTVGHSGLILHRGEVFYTDTSRAKGAVRHISVQWH